MLTNRLVIKCFIAVFLVSTTIKVFSQSNIDIPTVNQLNNSIDIYYNNINTINSQEYKVSKKYRWINYLPTPSYYPFAGGIGLSVNFLAPLQEYRLNSQANAKLNTLNYNTNLEKLLLKASCEADLKVINSEMELYLKGGEVDSLTIEEEKLFTQKYKANEITPSEYLSLKKTVLAYYMQRFIQSEAITQKINQLLLKAKMSIPLRMPILIKLPQN